MLRAALLTLVLAACNCQQGQIRLGRTPSDYPGISNFKYQLKNGTEPGDGSVNARLTWWKPPSSALPLFFYSFTVCRDKVKPCDVHYVRPSETELMLDDLDFWEVYNVAGYVFYNDESKNVTLRSIPETLNVTTNNGPPRPPVYFSATPTNSTTVLLTWFDPTGHRRAPNKYITEFCKATTCSNVTTKRSGSDEYQVLQTNLTGATLYSVKLYAVISNGIHTFTSKPRTTSFTTYGNKYESLENLQCALTKKSSSVDLQLTWDAPEGGETPCCYRFKACSSGSVCTSYEVVGAMKLTLGDKPYFNSTTVVGYACYTTQNGILCREGPSVNCDTGAGKPPAPGYLEAKSVAPTIVTVAWADPTKGSRRAPNFYKVDLCTLNDTCTQKYTVPYRDNETYSVTSYNLTAGTSYNAKVAAVISTNEGEEYTSDPATVQFTTQTSDFLPPDDFHASVNRHERRTDVSFTWSVPQHVHRNLTGYRILACEEVGSECRVFKAGGDVTTFTLKDEPYWQKYNVRAYALFGDYGATIESPSVSTDVFTGPVAPWVDNFNVTKQEGLSGIEVRWDGPHDEHVTGYNLTVCNTVTRLCEEAIFTPTPEDNYRWSFNDLDAWTNYTVRLYGYYFYENKWYNGTGCVTTVQTNPGDPGPVRDAHVHLVNRTVANFAWEKPSVLRGPLDGYTVVCESLHDEIPHRVEGTVAAHVNSLSLDLEEQQTEFQCNVTAYNLLSEKELHGIPVPLSVNTTGIYAPTHLNITLINATAVALKWDVDPLATNYLVNFTAAGWNESYVSNSSSANGTHTYVNDHLDPWTAYNITVQNCGKDYCGKKGRLHARTDAADPSEVQDFKFVLQKYVDLTFSWKLPKHPNGPINGYLLNVSNLERVQKISYKVDGQHTSLTANVTDQYTKYQALLVAFNLDRHHGGVLYGPAAVLNITTQGKGPMPPYPDPTELKSDSALIQWEVPQDKTHKIVSYKVNVSDHAGHEVFNATVHATNVTVDHLHPWSNYTAAVASCTNDTTCGPVFKAAKFTTDVSAPSVPRDLASTEVTKDSITLSWAQPSVLNGPIDGYIVQWNNGSGHASAITKEEGYKITGLPASTNCTIEVLSFNIGYTEQKRGPAATLSRVTLASVATSTIILAVILPILAIAIVVGCYFAFKKYRAHRSGATILQNVE
ncbi:phosphatidylinositol phosphatase PTPRQ-like [Ornithodoros turicata]|uniref:phosphatidylinositol phosphatase PTPRQ-like n=1 Tax=Ornithodoros turicata TaxID=34597 RepID=UPI0031387147